MLNNNHTILTVWGWCFEFKIKIAKEQNETN